MSCPTLVSLPSLTSTITNQYMFLTGAINVNSDSTLSPFPPERTVHQGENEAPTSSMHVYVSWSCIYVSPYTLVHKWFTTVWVYPSAWSVSGADQPGRICCLMIVADTPSCQTWLLRHVKVKVRLSHYMSQKHTRTAGAKLHAFLNLALHGDVSASCLGLPHAPPPHPTKSMKPKYPLHGRLDGHQSLEKRKVTVLTSYHAP